MHLIKRSRHIADRRRVLTGFTDKLQSAIVGLWRRTTIVDEGGGRMRSLPRELSALSRISQGAILQRGRDASMDRLRQVMMRNFLPNTPPSLPLTMSSHQNNNKSYLEFYKIGSSFFNLAFASGKKISSILCENKALQETRLSYGNLYIPLVVRWVVACTK